ncbi:MAG: hypothetical protein ACI9A7_001654 [Cyclobacteriaceae bacterium]
MIYYLLYVSYTKQTLTDEELKQLLIKSQKNNIILDVTGILLYMKNQFIQVLEGDKKTVQKIYKTISQDDRHQKVSTLLKGELTKRNFNNWSMGFQKLSATDFNDLTGFNDLIDFFKFPEILNDKHPAILFLKMFYDKNKPSNILDLS